MANQESGKIKQLKLRLPMAVYRQLEIDAEHHCDRPATRARHILGDALMSIDVSTPEEQERIKRSRTSYHSGPRGRDEETDK